MPAWTVDAPQALTAPSLCVSVSPGGHRPMGSINVGMNYAWGYNRYGAQIGPDPWVDPRVWASENAAEARGNLAAIHPAPILDHIDRNLKNLKGMGFDVIRWFLIGNGLVYGPPPVARSGGGFEFTPPSTLDKRFRRDFVAILEAFKRAGLKLLPSFIDFSFGGPCFPCPANGTASGGRSDVINDPAKRKTFLDTALGELLAASKGYEEQIFAWEVINEPFWMTTGFGPLSPASWRHRTPEVTDANLIDFLKDAIGRIHTAGFESTVGHRFLSDLDTYPTGTIRQFHYYAKSYSFRLGVTPLMSFSPPPVEFGDPPAIPPFSQTQAIIGEFGGTTSQSNPWPELASGSQRAEDRLKLLESKGYPRAMCWPDRDDAKTTSDDVIKLLTATRQSIVNYTGGALPPSNE